MLRPFRKFAIFLNKEINSKFVIALYREQQKYLLYIYSQIYLPRNAKTLAR